MPRQEGMPKDTTPEGILGRSTSGRHTNGGGVGMSEHFDLVDIGGGSAARDAAGKAAREHEARVALVEKERWGGSCPNVACTPTKAYLVAARSEEHTSELQSRPHLVCRLLLEKKKKIQTTLNFQRKKKKNNGNQKM